MEILSVGLSRGKWCYISLLCGASLFAAWTLWKRRGRKKQLPPFPIHKKSIIIVDSPQQWDAICPDLMQHLSSQKVLGLDCEWVLKKKVALLQLATAQGLCVLIRLFKLWPKIPHSLKSILDDRNILKVGVAVLDDGKKLQQDYGLKLMGCVDLRHMLRRVRGRFHCQSRGLKGLAEGVLHVNISKDFATRCGNWEAEVLGQDQINYAATDAAVAVDIFLRLVQAKMETSPLSNHRNSLGRESTSQIETHALGEDPDTAQKIRSQNEDPMCSPEQKNDVLQSSPSCNLDIQSDDVDGEDNGLHVEDCLKPENSFLATKGSKLFWKTARSMCQGIVDAGYVYNAKCGGLPSLSKKPDKAKKEATDAYSTRRRPLWDNCRLEAPDGSVLCTCDIRKAQWYLDKDLGEKVNDDPLTVRLLFEPSNKPQNERNYYLQEKENLCVVCGYDKDYVRKFVVPFEYRKYFPSALKDHSSHDVLLLCTTCHRRSCDFDSGLRGQLAEECHAPLESGASAKTVLDYDLQKVRSAGRALNLNKTSIPEHRVKELQKVLMDFFGVENLSEDLIKEAADIDARLTSEDFVPHGKQVVRYMAQHGGLLAFQARWRQHFLDTMDPKFLPAFWSVDFVPEGWTQQPVQQAQ